MLQVETFAACKSNPVVEALLMALRMNDKPLGKCRQTLKALCIERARQAALGQEKGAVIANEGDTAEPIGNFVDYLNQMVYEHFAPQIKVARKQNEWTAISTEDRWIL